MRCRIALVMTLSLVVGHRAHCENADDRSIEALITQLGSESFNERQAADTKLMEIGPAILPVVDRHKDSKNAELEFRLRRIREIVRADLAEDEFLPIFGQIAKPKEIKRFEVQPSTGKCESAVDSALQWLAKSQYDDGRWDSVKFGAETNADMEQTSFAVLAFLGAGHTPKVGQYKENVKKALAWLKTRQRADGAFLSADGGAVDNLTHAVAAIAMAEGAGMTNLPLYKDSAQLAVNFSATLQHTTNGERDGFGRNDKSQPDLLTTMFFTLQFKSAKVAALKVPHECFEGILAYSELLDDKQQCTFRSRVDGHSSPSAAIMGCVTRMMVGYKREDLEPYFSKAMALYRGHVDEKRPDVLMNYLAAMVAFQQGADAWKEYREHSLKALEYYHRDGEFEGSWDPRGVRSGMGRVATTALIALSFEFYYRQMQLQP